MTGWRIIEKVSEWFYISNIEYLQVAVFFVELKGNSTNFLHKSVLTGSVVYSLLWL